MSNTLPRFDHQTVDAKWQDRWSTTGRYRTPDPIDRDKKTYVLDMFPYPSGAGLHVGHPLGYIGSDVLARFLRAQGKQVFHPMGFDAFGLPAENYAIKSGVHPAVTTAQAIERYRQQLKLIGLSYDWDREINTSDPSYYRWTQWLFLQLYKRGLAYRAKAPVNWCPQCQTVLANEQVKDGTCERCDTPVDQRDLEQWFFKITDYADELLTDLERLDWPESIKTMQRNWINKSDGTIIRFKVKNQEFIEVFTTRPDTLYGVTYLVLAPEHPLIATLKSKVTNWQAVQTYVDATKKKTELERKTETKAKTGVELKDITAINPATHQEIPIWVADYVLGSYGTGAIMAVPAHDERDNAFAKQYNLPSRPVVLKDTTESRSFVMGVSESDLKDIGIHLVEKTKDGFLKILIPFNTLDAYKDRIREKMQSGFWNEFSTRNGFYFIFKHQDGHLEEMELAEKTNHLIDRYGMTFNGKNPKSLPEDVYSWLAENSFYRELLIHSDEGTLVNSGQFTGMKTADAREHITQWLKQSDHGQKEVTYRLRDWLVSRQRYWGPPIPMIICPEHGYVPVPEDQLPVLLPEDVDFKPTGQSPLVDSESFHAGVTCPECGASARREVDTLDTFVDSSWYFLRYADPNNSQLIFEPDRVSEWLPVDWYVGGAEHAVLHLLYARFMTKALADSGIINFREPFLRLRNQGLIGGEDGRKMSKRWGNVVNPDDVIRDYGADALRGFEMFMGPFEDAKPWSSRGIIGVRRWLDRVWRLQEKLTEREVTIAPETTRELTRSSLAISHMIEDFKFNTVVSQLMILTNALERESVLPSLIWKDYLELLAPIAPHLASELWERAGFPGFPDEAWPKRDEKDLVAAILVTPIQINGKTKIRDLSHPADLSESELVEYVKKQPAVLKLLSRHKIVTTVVKPGKILNFVVK